MEVSREHVEYWRRRQAEHTALCEALARQARSDLRAVVELLVQRYGATRVILFGSLARGRFSPGSDIDLAVEGIEKARFFEALADVNSLSHAWVDLKPLEALDPYFRKRVMEAGECLYASDER